MQTNSIQSCTVFKSIITLFRYLARINAYNVLSNKPLIKTEPITPKPPTEKLLISQAKMKDFITEAINMHQLWQGIIDGSVITPVIRKLREV